MILTNTNGKLVREIILNDFNGITQLDIQGLSKGMYFVQVEGSKTTQVSKLIIK